MLIFVALGFWDAMVGREVPYEANGRAKPTPNSHGKTGARSDTTVKKSSNITLFAYHICACFLPEQTCKDAAGGVGAA